jgi:acetylornithine deacetylase
VGEPTGMQPAIAEKGLMVLDATVYGKSGHAARDEGELKIGVSQNAIYKAIPVIEWFRNKQFSKVSPLSGAVKMTVTMVQAGTQHNVVPGECHFVVDIRPTDAYDNVEIVDMIRQHVKCDVVPRSTKHKTSAIAENHPLVQTAKALNIPLFVSPTTSDMVTVPFPAIKMGVGNSARSHQADEFIFIKEIEEGIENYITFLKTFLL